MRLIDADELKKRTVKVGFPDTPECGEFDAVVVYEIDIMPTIDPESLRPTAHIMREAVDHMKEPKLAYRGYTATVEYDEDDKLWHGTLDGIKDLVNFHAFEIENIEQEFRNAVDDYLDFCRGVGKEPERPLP